MAWDVLQMLVCMCVCREKKRERDRERKRERVCVCEKREAKNKYYIIYVQFIHITLLFIYFTYGCISRMSSMYILRQENHSATNQQTDKRPGQREISLPIIQENFCYATPPVSPGSSNMGSRRGSLRSLVSTSSRASAASSRAPSAASSRAPSAASSRASSASRASFQDNVSINSNTSSFSENKV